MFEEITTSKTNLQKRRLDAGLTQRELAKRSGLSLSCIRDFEQKQRLIENTSITTIIILCNILNCSIENIIDNQTLIEFYKKIKNK